MQPDDVREQLSQLIQLDIDAIHAYEQAIEKIDAQGVRRTLEEFKEDHERHVTQLSNEVRNLGGEPPDLSQDIKGVLIEGFTALRSATGTEGALKAMLSNEKLTNRQYEKALQKGLPSNIDALVRHNREDERRHLEYIERALERKVWQSDSPTHKVSA